MSPVFLSCQDFHILRGAINKYIKLRLEVTDEKNNNSYPIKVCSINSDFYAGVQSMVTFRSLFAFIRRKISSFIRHVARYTPSSTYILLSPKSQKPPRHN